MNEKNIDSESKKIFEQASQNYKQGSFNNAEILYKKVLKCIRVFQTGICVMK